MLPVRGWREKNNCLKPPLHPYYLLIWTGWNRRSKHALERRLHLKQPTVLSFSLSWISGKRKKTMPLGIRSIEHTDLATHRIFWQISFREPVFPDGTATRSRAFYRFFLADRLPWFTGRASKWFFGCVVSQYRVYLPHQSRLALYHAGWRKEIWNEGWWLFTKA